jgi:hypothetical protein
VLHEYIAKKTIVIKKKTIVILSLVRRSTGNTRKISKQKVKVILFLDNVADSPNNTGINLIKKLPSFFSSPKTPEILDSPTGSIKKRSLPKKN